MRLALPLLAALSSLLAACGANEKGADDAWSAEPQEKTHALRETEALNQPQVTPLSTAAAPSALLGVRHDLMLAEGKRATRCACLAVESGAAGDPAFFWTGGAPEIPADGLVVALGARGVDCPGGPADDARRRPSISAVDLENDDVIIEVEDLPEDRPLASGAIVPKPGPKGGLYVRPRDNKTIYAKIAGGARCKVR